MRRHLVAIALLAVAVTGCGDTAGDGREETTGTDETTAGVPDSTVLADLEASSPFALGAPPADLTLVNAGTGTAMPEWGQDSTGTDEPVTVLAPGGDVTAEGLVVVSVTGYADYQGGLDQAARSSNDDDLEVVEVGGRPARFLPAGDRDSVAATTWATLTVARGGVQDDLAVRVASPDATLDELAAIEASVVFAGRERGPLVEDPPDGLEVVGSAGTDAELLTGMALADDPSYVPGSERDHVAVWSDGSAGIGVATVPGGALDPGALPGLLAEESDAVVVEEVDVDGRAAVVVESATRFAPDVTSQRWLAVPTPWGDTLFVVAQARGDGLGGATDAEALPSVDELVALAASVTEADQATWDAFVATV